MLPRRAKKKPKRKEKQPTVIEELVEEDVPLNEQPDYTEHTQMNNFETTDQNILVEVDKQNLYRNQSIMKSKGGLTDLTGGVLAKKYTMQNGYQTGRLQGQAERNTMPYGKSSLSKTEFKGMQQEHELELNPVRMS